MDSGMVVYSAMEFITLFSTFTLSLTPNPKHRSLVQIGLIAES